MTQSSLFTRLLCTGAVGLFGLTAFGNDQTPSAQSARAQMSPNPISTSASAAGATQISKGEKLDYQAAQKAAIIAKNAPRAPEGPSPRGTNDDCANAIQINCGDTITGDTAGNTTDGVWPCAAGGSEQWYSFVAANTQAVLSLCGSSYDTAVMVLDGCGGPVLGCNDDSCGLQSQLTVCGLEVGNTYLIAVGGFASQTGAFTMSLTCQDPPPTCTPAQTGDIEENEPFGGCASNYTDAFNGGCNSVPPAFSPIACGDTVHGESGTFTFGTLNYRDTDWWLFDVTGTGAIVTWTVTADFPVLIGFVAQPCPQGAFMANTAFTAPACVEVSSTTACLPPGQYVAFVAPSGFSGVCCGSEYRGTLTCTPCEPPPPPANDTCATAIGINCGDTINGDNTSATNDGLAISCSFGGAPTNSDLWYSFVASDPVARVSLCGGGSLGDTVVSVYDGCGGTELACNDDFCGLLSETVVSGLNPGSTYLIRVATWNSPAQGTFTLALTCGVPPSCAPAQTGDIEENEPFGGCATDYTDAFNGGCNSNPPAFSPIDCGDTVHGESGTFTFGVANYRDTDWWLFDVTGTGAIVTWTVTADFPVLIGFLTMPCPNGSFIPGTAFTAPACTEVSSTTACLPPGQYVAFVAPSTFAGIPCGSQYRGTLTCTPCEPPPAPVNDLCANAIAVNCGDTVTGDTTGATTDGGWTCAAGGSDIWYSYVAAGPSVTVSLCGSAYDTALMMLTGCGGTVLACDDDFCAGFGPSQITVNGLTPGNTYLIAVGGFAAQQGSFTMTLSGCAATGACCLPETCVVTTAANCASQGGSYSGDGTDCGGASYAAVTCSDTLEDISATGTLLATASGCDDCGETVALPFAFPFFGNTYNSIGVASNGYMTFGGVLGVFGNVPIPNTAVPNDLIAPLWDDFHTGNNGEIYVQSLTSPTRFVVMWNQVARFGNAASRNTFEAILYPNGDIDYRYGAVDIASLSATVGIENIDGTVGLALASPAAGDTCRSIERQITGDPCGDDCGCVGDLDGDGDRDIGDLSTFLSQFGQTGAPGSLSCADTDADGDVDIADLSALLSVFGVPCP